MNLNDADRPRTPYRVGSERTDGTGEINGTNGTDGTDDALTIDYVYHRRVNEMLDVIRYCLESISLGFDRWGEPHVKGPGFYVAIVSGPSIAGFADPMGANRWPIETCRTVLGDIERFYEAALAVSADADGAVIASIDGVLLPRMVRLKDLTQAELDRRFGSEPPYADWMGSRHMSALDTSIRDEVVATITLSEENGRVTVFTGGRFDDYCREEIGGRWRTHP